MTSTGASHEGEGVVIKGRSGRWRRSKPLVLLFGSVCQTGIISTSYSFGARADDEAASTAYSTKAVQTTGRGATSPVSSCERRIADAAAATCNHANTGGISPVFIEHWVHMHKTPLLVSLATPTCSDSITKAHVTSKQQQQCDGVKAGIESSDPKGLIDGVSPPVTRDTRPIPVARSHCIWRFPSLAI